MSEYRHEYKYLCSLRKLELVRSRIEPVMVPDPHTGSSGIYQIRSLYFDDYKDSCLWENRDGTDPREKFRIRIYDGEASVIRLELKQKQCRKNRKLSCLLPEELCRKAMRGETLPLEAVDSPVYRKFCLQQMTRMLAPKVIVEYDRVPFVYPDGNVRVTFDRDIRSSRHVNRFLEKEIPSRPVMPEGLHVLEVKFDEYIPDFIYRCTQAEKLRQTSFSKYEVCRRITD